jgi:preprotein translocase subunit YajC
MMGGFLPIMIVMFAVMYFLMIRPQQKKQKKITEMLNAMKKGDRVLTTGGIIGVISSIKDDIVILKVAENTKMEFKKSAISSVIGSENTGE